MAIIKGPIAERGDKVTFYRKEIFAMGKVIQIRPQTALVQLEPSIMQALSLTTDLTVVSHGRYKIM